MKTLVLIAALVAVSSADIGEKLRRLNNQNGITNPFFIPKDEGSGLLASAAENNFEQRKQKERNHTLEELCNDAFHSFLCKPVTGRRRRLDGKLRPGAKLPPDLMSGSALLAEQASPDSSYLFPQGPSNGYLPPDGRPVPPDPFLAFGSPSSPAPSFPTTLRIISTTPKPFSIRTFPTQPATFFSPVVTSTTLRPIIYSTFPPPQPVSFVTPVLSTTPPPLRLQNFPLSNRFQSFASQQQSVTYLPPVVTSTTPKPIRVQTLPPQRPQLSYLPPVTSTTPRPVKIQTFSTPKPFILPVSISNNPPPPPPPLPPIRFQTFASQQQPISYLPPVSSPTTPRPLKLQTLPPQRSSISYTPLVTTTVRPFNIQPLIPQQQRQVNFLLPISSTTVQPVERIPVTFSTPVTTVRPTFRQFTSSQPFIPYSQNLIIPSSTPAPFSFIPSFPTIRAFSNTYLPPVTEQQINPSSPSTTIPSSTNFIPDSQDIDIRLGSPLSEGGALLPESAQNPSVRIRPENYSEDNLERLCNDPFHSFLCKPISGSRQRLNGMLRPQAQLPANLIGANSFPAPATIPVRSGSSLLPTSLEADQPNQGSPTNENGYVYPKENNDLETVLSTTIKTEPSTGYNYPKPADNGFGFQPSLGPFGYDYPKPQSNPPIIGSPDTSGNFPTGYEYPKPSNTFPSTIISASPSKPSTGYEYPKPADNQNVFTPTFSTQQPETSTGYNYPKPPENQIFNLPSPSNTITGYEYPKPSNQQPAILPSTPRPESTTGYDYPKPDKPFGLPDSTNSFQSGYEYPRPSDGSSLTLPTPGPSSSGYEYNRPSTEQRASLSGLAFQAKGSLPLSVNQLIGGSSPFLPPSNQFEILKI